MLSQKKLGKGYKLEFWKAGLTFLEKTGHLTVSKAVLCLIQSMSEGYLVLEGEY
jgi:hypothetical protein